MEGRFEADFDVSGEDGDDGGNSPIGEYSRVLFNSGMRDCRSSKERSKQKGECATQFPTLPSGDIFYNL